MPSKKTKKRTPMLTKVKREKELLVAHTLIFVNLGGIGMLPA